TVYVLEYPALTVWQRIDSGQRRGDSDPSGGPRPALMKEPDVTGAECLEDCVHRQFELLRRSAVDDSCFVRYAKLWYVDFRTDELRDDQADDPIEHGLTLRFNEIHVRFSVGLRFRRDDDGRCVAVRKHTAPQLWDGLRTERRDHFQLGQAQRLADV